MPEETTTRDAGSQVPPTLPDLRPVLFTAFDQAERVIASVDDEQLGNPTPCTEWDVAQLLQHLVLVAHRIDVLGRGGAPRDLTEVLIGDGGYLGALREGRAKAQATWSDDAILTRPLRAPWGMVPGAVVLSGYVPEVVQHTWDLWIALDRPGVLDPALAESALQAARRAIPAQRDGFPFAAVVEVPGDADPYRRLAGWMGRTPA